MAYLTAAEITTRLATLLTSGDAAMQAWSAMSAEDQAVLAARASDDLDAIRTYRGQVLRSDQEHLWPRYDSLSGLLVGQPIDVGSEYPTALLDGVALQAASLAARAMGVDSTGEALDAAQRGVTSAGGGGLTETIDLRKAGSPEAQLSAVAWRRIQRLTTATASVQ